MIIVKTILVALEAIICLLLIGLVLLQRSKGAGLGTAFGGGGAGESLFGSRAGNVLTKATVVLGCAFLLNTIFLGMLFAGGAVEQGASGVTEELRQEDEQAQDETPASGETATPDTGRNGGQEALDGEAGQPASMDGTSAPDDADADDQG